MRLRSLYLHSRSLQRQGKRKSTNCVSKADSFMMNCASISTPSYVLRAYGYYATGNTYLCSYLFEVGHDFGRGAISLLLATALASSNPKTHGIHMHLTFSKVQNEQSGGDAKSCFCLTFSHAAHRYSSTLEPESKFTNSSF